MRGKKRVLPVESVPNGPKQKIKNNENRGPQSNYEIGWRRPGADKEGGGEMGRFTAATAARSDGTRQGI